MKKQIKIVLFLANTLPIVKKFYKDFNKELDNFFIIDENSFLNHDQMFKDPNGKFEIGFSKVGPGQSHYVFNDKNKEITFEALGNKIEIYTNDSSKQEDILKIIEKIVEKLGLIYNTVTRIGIVNEYTFTKSLDEILEELNQNYLMGSEEYRLNFNKVNEFEGVSYNTNIFMIKEKTKPFVVLKYDFNSIFEETYNFTYDMIKNSFEHVQNKYKDDEISCAKIITGE